MKQQAPFLFLVTSLLFAMSTVDAQTTDGPSTYTTTNVLEEGVDEPDLVETNGETSFFLRGRYLHVLDTWPAEEPFRAGTTRAREVPDECRSVGGSQRDRWCGRRSVWGSSPSGEPRKS